MSLARRLCRFALALPLVLAFAVIAAAPAQAAIQNCPSGSFCLWEGYEHDGGMYRWSGDDSTLANDYFRAGVPVSNNASSIYNNGHVAAYDDVRIYDGTGYTGASFCVARSWWYKFRTTPSLIVWDNRVSSYRWVGAC